MKTLKEITKILKDMNEDEKIKYIKKNFDAEVIDSFIEDHPNGYMKTIDLFSLFFMCHEE